MSESRDQQRAESRVTPEAGEKAQAAPGLSRRDLLRWSTLAGAGAALGASGGEAAAEGLASEGLAAEKIHLGGSVVEASIADLQAAMASGRLSSLGLVHRYLLRIQGLDRHGTRVRSVLELNPDAKAIAHALDQERQASGPRGPLHGIPILLKDNIDTADSMMTTAGSLALVGAAPLQDSTVAARLRAAGAVILGKANLSEWANFRSFASSSGWSGRGGQCKNPYVLDRNPCGSSSGSAAAVAASFATVALGTETDGSIVCPSSANGVVGIKPTVGLTSRAGVVPISATQDTVGPQGRTVADAAAVLGALTGVDPRDPATQASAGNSFSDYTAFLDPNGLQGARIGVARTGFTGNSEETDAIFESAVAAMAAAGATIVDPADIPTINQLNADPAELTVLLFEFKRDLNAYLATRPGIPVASLADCIQFNLDNASRELKFFRQELFDLAESDPFTEQQYQDALVRGKMLAAEQGIDAVLDQFNLDALVAPTNSPAWPTDLINGDHFVLGSSSAAAVAGYPLITVPAGFSFGLPVGITFMGRAWSEPTLIKVASGFEAATQVRRRPKFLPTLRLNKSAAARRSACGANPQRWLSRYETAVPTRRPLAL